MPPIDWPAWLGTPLQGGAFVLLLILAVKTSPAWLTTWSTMRLAKSNANAERIAALERQVKECRDECAAQERRLLDQIHGLRTQRNTEQLAIMRAIVRMSGDPMVKQQLELLEAMEIEFTQQEEDKDGT